MSLVPIKAGGRGLLVGPRAQRAGPRANCEKLKEMGLLCKKTHEFVIRITPPLVTNKDDLEWAVGRILLAFGQWLVIKKENSSWQPSISQMIS